MRVATMVPRDGERRAKRLRRIIGVLVAGAALVLLLGTTAWAQSSSPTVAAAPTTSTDASGTATTTSTDASGTVTTTAAQAPFGLLPPVVGTASLNPGWKTSQMVAQVWPEYDKEAVLVIMDFDLPADVPLPATFKFAIPTGASIAGLAEVDPSGNFTYKAYPPVETGTDWDIATIQVQKYRSLQIDYYYDPGLPTGAGPRSFPLLLKLPLDVASLNLHVQQPARATDFKVTPALQASGAAQDGFTYAVAAFSDVAAGSTFGYVISYNKPDAQPSATASGTSTATKLNTTTVLLAVIAVIVVFIGGMIFFYLFRRGGKPAPTRAQRRAKTPPGRATAAPRNAEAKKPAARPMSAVTKDQGRPAGGEAATKETADGPKPSDQEAPGYCAACGEDLVKNARFCPSCGEAQGR